MTRNDQIAEDKRKRLSEIETAYLRAKDYEKSEQFKEDRLKALEKIRCVLRQELMEQSKALQMIGRVQQVLLDTYQHENTVLEYEGLRKTLKEMFPSK